MVYGTGEYEILQILTCTDCGAEVFNYFFTVVWITGLIGFLVGLLVRIISRS